MTEAELKDQIEEATLDFTMGEHEEALAKIDAVLKEKDDLFEAWHARAEVLYAEKRYDEALESAEKALALNPQDVHINTSLSRIWVEKGDKDKAEHYNAQARMLSWKATLAEEPPPRNDG